jgi:hypothetical protein
MEKSLGQQADEIVEGWARVAEGYSPRPLTQLEHNQVDRASLEEDIAKRTPFVLGEPLSTRRIGV